MSQKSGSYVSIACDNCRKRRRKCDGKVPCQYCASKNKPCIYDKSKDKRRTRVDLHYVDFLEHKFNNVLNFIKGVRSTTSDEKLRSKCTEILANNDPKFVNNQDMGINENVGQDEIEKLNKSVSLNFAINNLVSMKWEVKHDYANDMTKFLGPPVRQVNAKGRRFDQISSSENSYFQQTLLQDGTYLRQLIISCREKVLPFNHALEEINFDEITKLSTKLDCDIGDSLTLLTFSILTYGFEMTNSPHKSRLNSINPFLIQVEQSILRFLRQSTSFNHGNYINHARVTMSILILLLFYLNTYDEFQAWTYSGLLCSQIQQMGWNVASITQGKADIVKFRSKLTWNAILIDKVASVMFGRSSSINFRRLLINFYTCETHDSNELIFQFNTKLWFLIDKFMEQIYSFQFNTKNKVMYKKILVTATQSLKEFQQFMDQYLPLNETNLRNENIILLHLTFQVSLTLIIRPYMGIEELSGSIFLKSLSIADQCFTLIRSYFKLNKGWYNCHYPFLVYQSSIFVLGAVSMSDLQCVQMLISNLSHLLHVLRLGSEYLPIYQVYHDSLLEFYQSIKFSDSYTSQQVAKAFENESIDTLNSDELDFSPTFNPNWDSFIHTMESELKENVFNMIDEGLLFQ